VTNAPGRRDLARRGLAALRAIVPSAVGFTLATAGLAAVSSLATVAPPLVDAKRALFVVGWVAVGVVSLAAWRRADGTELADPRADSQGRTERPRTDGGRTRRFDRSALRWRVLVAGLTALGASVLLEVGFGVGG